MPKFPTFPTLYNEVLTIPITKLKEWGYLKPGQFKSGTMNWSSNGNERGSISIAVNTYTESPYLEVDYKFRDKPVKYQVQLISIPSNIGKGEVWYFICPHTGKKCRKLYSVGERFLHREAFNGCMYESQTYSKKTRSMFKFYDKAFGTDKLYEQLYSKHFKSYYAGKPTKRFAMILKKIEASESIPYSEKERIFLP